ncbi:MAG TPA: DUF1998 domain-containing protein [Ktedonobacteraceae bacterium]|nr:DUF1998 domain-containing protein [Ktedonobacteraceae bacterium]
MDKNKTRHIVGDLRPSQLLLTYGVGALVDLPHLSALVMGLENWQTSHATEIIEERLLAAVRSILGPQVSHLYAPPLDESSSGQALIGVPVAAFPRWLVCPACRLLAPIESGLFTLRTQTYRPDRTWYYHKNCNKNSYVAALPSRFIIACEHGHMDDFPWHEFVHRGKECRRPVLRMEEQGPSGEPSTVVIRCDACQEKHSMAEAFSSEEENNFRPTCTGRSPHLRGAPRQQCPAGQARTTLLSASNTWFPLAYSLLSLPVAEDLLGQLVEKHWETLREAESKDEVVIYRKMARLKQDFAEYSNEEIWQKIEAQRDGAAAAIVKPGELKLPEWQVLIRPQSAPASPDFQISDTDLPDGYAHVIEQVVLVERLREVQALTGFTRIESLSDYTEEEKLPQEHIMPLTRKRPEWIPASEVRGEGLFIQFREQAIQNWLARPELQAHNQRFFEAHKDWRASRHLDDPEANYPELRYVLLHTFAHALMRQLSLECGYAAASLRERIYAQGPNKPGGSMAGILLYTAASDSEGTLGGLVSLGNELGYHIAGALEAMQYCASDPLCAEHLSFNDHTLHGASCHACLFAPETSCERGNKYLDRSVLIGTMERGDLAFFEAVIG